VIKAELHPPHWAGRQATIHPSRLLLMNWASKNLRLLSHPLCIRVTATMLVTRLKRRRCNRRLRQQSHTLRRRTLRCRPSLRCASDVINNGNWHIILASAVSCVDVRRLRAPCVDVRRHVSPYVHVRACRMRRRTAPYAV